MAASKQKNLPSSGPRESVFARIARAAADWSGSTAAFMLAVLVIVIWLFTGPIFAFSDTWQLVINTGTTIVTFLMVFLIQRAQNKDAQALHLKLNELVAAMQGASNRLINAENLAEDELRTLHAHYCKLVELAQRDQELTASHSVEEAEDRHADKAQGRRDQKADETAAGGTSAGGKKRKKSK
ncbi:MAG TPA: low affinity iron permease family protein [Gemmataceae bacterium]|jgi:low affinity Fe/Cu permease|nr:low affinity iron permease family protein [Gemmataceae bacterium]